MSARSALRSATRAAHERVDAAFAAHDLAALPAYGRFLQAQAAALLPVERALGSAGADALAEAWDEHRRAPLLIADLAALELAPGPFVTPPAYASDAHLAGGLYVIEGSRLGGAVLRRQVPGAFPSAFLSARQAPGRWPRFVANLDRLLYSPQRVESAIEAALATFACFETAAGRGVA